jgi:hypothetical protein
MYAGFAGAKTGHGHVMFYHGLIRRCFHAGGLTALASFGGCHLYPVFAVRCKHPVKAGQVGTGFRNQRCQLGNEVKRFEEDVRGAIPVRCLMMRYPVNLNKRRSHYEKALFRKTSEWEAGKLTK